ncbi:GTP-binding protein [Plasmodium gonderi]|uniref:GTP-binding protein n=1 Tax=Plasmodium gonderi TaxID=77519 RepID=A0A1Y1JNH1_PLAGO|nr:GTP-binding protein [Plasmodium gonderi]GAW81943.1 GTP-binding protein [Plasmodium gonderi]
MGVTLFSGKGKQFYSIRIVDKATNKNIKTYEHSSFGVKNKKSRVERIHKEKGNYKQNEKDKMEENMQCPADEQENRVLSIKSDMCKVGKRMSSIFYESERIIKCESGSGGDGAVSFKKFKRKVLGPLGIPNGGKGGNGGNIYLCYSDINGGKNEMKWKNRGEHKYMYIKNLAELPCTISSTVGGKGRANQLRGKNGMSIFIYLNKMCHVYRLFPRAGEKMHGRGEHIQSEGQQTGSGKKEIRQSDEFFCNLRESTNCKKGEPFDERKNKFHMKETNKWTTSHVTEDHTNLVYYKSHYENKVYNVIKKEDPVYIKKNMHILKELIKIDEQVGREIHIGFLNKINNCILICKGGEGGKGNNMQNTYSFEKGKKGEVSFIKIVYKCISDTCFLGYQGSGKSTLLSLITHKIHTVNNSYVLKKIIFTDNFQVSVADFFSENDMGIDTDLAHANEHPLDKFSQNKNSHQSSPFRVNSNFIHYLELTHLLVIVLDMMGDPTFQFCSIREELRQKDENIYHKPYIVVINKCDVNFEENMKRAEEAYRAIKTYGGNEVPIFFISAKYAMGIDKFVSCLKSFVQKLKYEKC